MPVHVAALLLLQPAPGVRAQAPGARPACWRPEVVHSQAPCLTALHAGQSRGEQSETHVWFNVQGLSEVYVDVFWIKAWARAWAWAWTKPEGATMAGMYPWT